MAFVEQCTGGARSNLMKIFGHVVTLLLLLFIIILSLVLRQIFTPARRLWFKTLIYGQRKTNT